MNLTESVYNNEEYNEEEYNEEAEEVNSFSSNNN